MNSVVCVAVIEVADVSTDVTLMSFISTMEYRLAAVYSHAMSVTESSVQRRRQKRARMQHNATIQVQSSTPAHYCRLWWTSL